MECGVEGGLGAEDGPRLAQQAPVGEDEVALDHVAAADRAQVVALTGVEQLVAECFAPLRAEDHLQERYVSLNRAIYTTLHTLFQEPRRRNQGRAFLDIKLKKKVMNIDPGKSQLQARVKYTLYPSLLVCAVEALLAVGYEGCHTLLVHLIRHNSEPDISSSLVSFWKKLKALQ